MTLKIRDLVGRLWKLCNILRESGISYPEYVTELTYLLFLKMVEETGKEELVPEGCRWSNLTAATGVKQFRLYKQILPTISRSTRGVTQEIFRGAETALKEPRHLNLLVDEFNKTNWYAAREESAFADLYEGLLEKNSNESKSGAGQYFTPRPLIECMVALTRPLPGEIIQDPACGTAGFLIAADRHIKGLTRNHQTLSPRKLKFQREEAFIGVELVSKTHRLAVMNASLHGIHSPIIEGDALGDAGAGLPQADLILTNPPFGTKAGGGLPTRAFPIPTSNKQLAFLQHIYLSLKPGGRAAVVLPDLQGAAAPKVCADLMDKCNLHTVLRLPTGIFYAPGVQTNVLFFTRGKSGKSNTRSVRIYDLRSDMPRFGKRTPLVREHFADFETGYHKTQDMLEKGQLVSGNRWQIASREDISSSGERFDLFDRRTLHQAMLSAPSPRELADSIADNLKRLLKELGSLTDDLS